MSKIFKILLILLIITSIGSAVLAVLAFIGKEREYTKRLLVEDKLASTLKEKKDLEKELEGVKVAKEDVEAKLVKIETKIKEISTQFEEEKEKNVTLVSTLDTKKSELEKIKVDLENEKREKLAISKKLETLQFDYEKTKKEVSRIESEKKDLEKKITELEQKNVNLDKIVVNPVGNTGSTAVPFQPSKQFLQGKVLVVNREYSFVVIDVGQDKGIQKGMIFEVTDGKELLGSVEIDKVYDTMSSATVLSDSRINDIKKGNLVIESR